MNTTVLTTPRASALVALVPFNNQKAHVQLQLWAKSSAKAWSAALTHQTDCIDFLDDAEFTLAEARSQHSRRSHQKRAKADEANDDAYESEPEWANEAIVEAEEALRAAKRNKKEAHEAARDKCTEKLRAVKMLQAFLANYPEFQQVAAATTTKRKRSQTEDDDKRSRKRPQHTSSTILPQETTDRQTALQAWRKAAKAAFADRAAMTTFPEPPAWPCFDANCRKQDKSDRLLKACECNIRAAFQGLGLTGVKELKKERHEWHPDRFAVCMEEKREGWQRMATEVFTAVSAMIREE